ncbi:unnamed protein product [Didymodactylos carnosus]|uniref:Uncharacterized protein n=1 Tax=Didymodactylos carnosus TaxID=1234261 RepID=A0A814AR02_9BILA|nr:unnamed protein product [Didymodactylos carnosus]CAF3697638.1 unnamed protein product [Didymodactylos carnosus]
MTNSSCNGSACSLNVKHVATLFEEVQNRYVTKLASIDEKNIQIDERYKQKLSVYENYVKDLSVQTRLLLQSLDELEKEANQRVTLLENKLKKTHATLQSNYSLSDVTKTVSTVEAEKWKLTHDNLDLKHDLDSLVSFINHAKRTGRWETKKLNLIHIPYEKIVGVTSDDLSKTVVNPLSNELKYRNDRIEILQKENDQLRQIQNDLTKKVIL